MCLPASARRTACALLLGLLLPVVAGGPPASAAPLRGAAQPSQADEITRVVVVSVDGLNPDAITRLGAAGAPTFYRLMDEGAWTLNARTEVERTVTLPNHTSMLTGRRVDRTRGGHGVTWDDDRLVPRTVQAAAGHPVGSVFSRLATAGSGSAMFATKTKFSLYDRSWPALGRAVIDLDNARLTAAAQRDLARSWRAFTFVHLSLPDVAGHAHGWLSAEYLDAVRQSDTLIGALLSTITRTTESRDHTLVVVTSDHGGRGTGHSNPRLLADYRIPFLVWGPGVAAGADLYAINPTYADPGTRRVGYAAARQPVRNGDVANLVLDVLGLPAIPGSELDAAQDLEVSP